MRPWSVALAVSLVASTAHAQQAITDNNYTLEYFQGPVTSSGRVIGLGGAFTAVAEWCEGEYSNAASPAARPRSSLRAFDFDLCLGFTAPGAFGGSDFENAGRNATSTRFSGSATFNLGLQIIYRMFGATLVFDTFTLHVPNASTQTDIGINRITTSVATSFLSGQLLLGVGLRAATFQANTTDAAGVTTQDFSQGGAGFQVGAIIAPSKFPFRLGVTARGPISIEDVQGKAGGKILPSRVELPWEVEVGGAVELAARTLNPVWVNPAIEENVIRDRYRGLDKARLDEQRRILASTAPDQRKRKRDELEKIEHDAKAKDTEAMDAELVVLAAKQAAERHRQKRQTAILMGSLLVTGGVPNAVSITGFIDQQRVPYGSRTSVSPRIGIEGELVKNWLMVRAGSYLEPSLFDDVPYRVHFTGGLDLKLFVFNPFGIFGPDPWRIRLAADGAARYFNTSFSLGKYY